MIHLICVNNEIKLLSLKLSISDPTYHTTLHFESLRTLQNHKHVLALPKQDQNSEM